MTPTPLTARCRQAARRTATRLLTRCRRAFPFDRAYWARWAGITLVAIAVWPFIDVVAPENFSGAWLVLVVPLAGAVAVGLRDRSGLASFGYTAATGVLGPVIGTLLIPHPGDLSPVGYFFPIVLASVLWIVCLAAMASRAARDGLARWIHRHRVGGMARIEL